jgi:hypothetical protein
LSQNGTTVRFRKDGREGTIDGLTELAVGPCFNPDSLTQYRVNIGDPDRTLAIEENFLTLTDDGGVMQMVRQKSEYRRVATKQLRARFASDHFVKPV